MTKVATLIHTNVLTLLFTRPCKHWWIVATLCFIWCLTTVIQLATAKQTRWLHFPLFEVWSSITRRMISQIFGTQATILSKVVPNYFPHMDYYFTTDIWSEATHNSWHNEYLWHLYSSIYQRPWEECSPDSLKGHIWLDCFVSFTTTIFILSTVIFEVQISEGLLHL
jgi:hypothetical protein